MTSVTRFGGVAQLVRASACHAEGRGFEPHRPRHSPTLVKRGGFLIKKGSQLYLIDFPIPIY